MGKLFWISASAAIALYLVMVTWSLPHLGALAGGVPVFDMRPTGYTPHEAAAILDALGEEGRDFYRAVQLRLDTVYPALLALMLSAAFLRLFPRPVAMALSLVAVAAAGFDYLENAAVAEMIAAWPDGFGDALAARASRWSVLKASTTTLALVAFLIGLLAAGWRRVRQTRAA